MPKARDTRTPVGTSDPAAWPMVRLREVATFGSGTTPARANHERYYENGTVAWVKTGDLTNDDVHNTDEQITQAAVAECSCKVYPTGTVLIAMYGGFKQIGRTGLLKVPAAINQALTAVAVDRQRLDPAFLLDWLNSSIGKWRRLAASSRKDPNITKSDIQQFFVPTPPIDIQKSVSALLRMWNKAVLSTERLLKLKRRLKRGLMQQLLTGRRRFPEFTTQAWREMRIGDVLAEQFRPVAWDDNATYRLASVRRNSKGLFWREALTGGRIKVKKLHTIRAGDFLLSHIQAAYGAMAIVPAAFDGGNVSNMYTILAPREATQFDARFFGYLAERPEMKHAAYVSSNGFFAERLRLNFDPRDFLRRKIFIPPTVAEQQKIIAVLAAADREIALLEQQLAALREQKKGLMQKLLTGQVRVNVKAEAKHV